MLTTCLLLVLAGCESSEWDRKALTGPEANRLVASIEIRPTGAVLEPDALEQFAAVVKSARGQTVSRDVTWRSLDEGVLRVDAEGVGLGLTEGVATLEAAYQGVTARATVDVHGEVVDIRPHESSLDVGEGETVQLQASYIYANGAVRPAGPLEWTSVDPSILAVDADGLARGIQGGRTKLRIRGRGHEVFLDGLVRVGAVKSVEVIAPTTSLAVGDEVQFWVEVRSARGKSLFRPVEWSSTNGSVASVSAAGVVRGLMSGRTTISARADGVEGAVEITVGAPGSQSEARPGKVSNLTVVSTAANAATLRFREVDDGTGKAASYEVRYAEAPLGFGWGAAMRVAKGTCKAPIRGTAIGNMRTCTAESLQPSRNYDFQLVPFRGTMQQDATYGALSNIATARTQDAPIHVEVLPSGATLEVGEELQLRANVTDAYGTKLDRTVSWSSSRSSVAFLSASGNTALLTAWEVGDTEVRASTAGAHGTARIRVMGRSDRSAGEPSGFRRIAEHDFSCRPGEGCARSGIWRESDDGWHRSNLSVVHRNDAPHSPSGVIRTRFPSGLRAGSAPTNFSGWSAPGREYRAIYISKWVRIQGPDYENHPGITKMGWVGYGEGTVGNHSAFVLQTQPHTGRVSIVRDLQPVFVQQNHVNSARYGWPKMRVGEWIHWEALLELNSLGRRDGVLKWWIDGELVVSANDMVYITPGNERGFYGYRWGPVWGGTGDFSKSRDDFIEIDHVYISGLEK